MGVITNGAYGIPKNLNFSFPIICSDKNWKIVEGLNVFLILFYCFYIIY